MEARRVIDIIINSFVIVPCQKWVVSSVIVSLSSERIKESYQHWIAVQVN